MVLYIVVGASFGIMGFLYPLAFSEIVDVAATVLSVLIGVSLAIFAILASSVTVTNPELGSRAERKRMSELVKEDDVFLTFQQYILFVVFFAALVSGLIFKLIVALSFLSHDGLEIRMVSSFFSFSLALSFLLAFRLPALLRGLVVQRRSLKG